MYAHDAGGARLEAEYAVEQSGNELALVLESSSGRDRTRGRRNPDYRRALEVLLGRLAELDAVLEDALVDSGVTQRLGLTEAERRLIDKPLRLAAEPDITALRIRLTNRQRTVGQAPGATGGGNATKRIRLLLSVPGFKSVDAERLKVLLAQPHGEALYRSADEPVAEPGQLFDEGAVTRVTVNRYERDPRARRQCLDHYGIQCSVCDLDFGARYGELGKGFIHVHHLRELSTVGTGYQVDPVNDLRPVCPNCHAMLHMERPALLPEDLRQRLTPGT